MCHTGKKSESCCLRSLCLKCNCSQTRRSPQCVWSSHHPSLDGCICLWNLNVSDSKEQHLCSSNQFLEGSQLLVQAAEAKKINEFVKAGSCRGCGTPVFIRRSCKPGALVVQMNTVKLISSTFDHLQSCAWQHVVCCCRGGESVEVSRAQLLENITAAKEGNELSGVANPVQTVVKKMSVRSGNVPMKYVFPAQLIAVSLNDVVESGDVSLFIAPLMSRGGLWQHVALCRLARPEFCFFNNFIYFC